MVKLLYLVLKEIIVNILIVVEVIYCLSCEIVISCYFLAYGILSSS